MNLRQRVSRKLFLASSCCYLAVLQPVFATSYLEYGYQCLRIRDYSKAEGYFKAEIASHNTSAPGHYGLAQAYFMESRFPDAIKELNSTIQFGANGPYEQRARIALQKLHSKNTINHSTTSNSSNTNNSNGAQNLRTSNVLNGPGYSDNTNNRSNSRASTYSERSSVAAHDELQSRTQKFSPCVCRPEKCSTQ